ncbi:MAG: hypothetical protein ACKOPO_04905 [Novosphingobium sp.]
MLRRIHRATALLLGLFLLAHIGNHLIALAGVSAHIAAMEGLRAIYRNPLIECLLLAAFALQMVTGGARLIAGWRGRKGKVAWLQAGTGAYLAVFLFIHVSAVSGARTGGVDTNFHFAAAGLHVPHLPWFFVPYYTLAVACLFTHLGCAGFWALLDRGRKRQAGRFLVGMAAAGGLIATVITAILAGLIVPVEIPASYLRPLGG